VNVLIFSHTSLLGGAELSLLQLVKELVHEYNTTCTVVLPNQGPLCKLLKTAGASIIFAPIHWWCTLESLQNPDEVTRQYCESFDWLNEHLEDLENINPDVVLTNTIVIPWGAFAALFLKRPHAWMINEFGVLDHGLEFFLPFVDVLEFIEKFSDKVITRSNAVKNELFHHLADNKVQTIYRDIEIPDRLSEPAIGDNIFTLPNALRVIILGTISKAKGQEDALRSVKELVKNRNRCVELVIVGKDQQNYQKYLQRIIDESDLNEYIHILPFRKNVFPIIEQADLILICSRMEAFSRVIMEGMLMEKAIIATDTGGTPELITHGETGLLYPPGNYLALADQIELLVENPLKMRQLAQRGNQFAKNNFTREKFSGAFIKIINNLQNKEVDNQNHNLRYFLFHYQSLLAKSNLEIEKLNKALEESEKEVLDYALSNSWQFTRLIRKIMKLFRKSKNA